MKKKWFVVLLSISILLTGCGTNSKSEKKASDITEAKTLQMMEINEISSMDSRKAFDGGSFIAITQVMEGLYNLDEKDQLVPGVATELPTISEDGLVYKIPLREDAYWSNEEQVTADDFVYAWQQIVDPKSGATGAFLLLDVVKNATEINQGKVAVDELGIKAVSKYELEITLEHPVPYFTSMLTFPTLFPLNKNYVEKQGEKYAQDSEHLIYNGVFKLADWKGSNQTWSYEQNNHYWNKEQTNVEKIEMQVIKDTNLAVNLYNSKELDRAVLSGEFASQNKDNPDLVVSLDSWSHILEVNQGKDRILQNKEARQAVAKSIDRKEITERLLNNGSIASHGLVPREFVFNPETKKDFRDEKPLVNEFNQKEGTQIWQKFLSESGTKEVSLTLLASDQDENKHITEFIQFSLEETLPNTKITIEMMPEKNLLERREKGDFDLILNRVGPDFQDPLTFMNQYISTSDSNVASYQNKSYDELLKEAEKLATQPEERWNKLVEAEDLLLKDAGVIPIYQSANTALQRPTYDGLIHHLFGPPNYYGKIKMK